MESRNAELTDLTWSFHETAIYWSLVGCPASEIHTANEFWTPNLSLNETLDVRKKILDELNVMRHRCGETQRLPLLLPDWGRHWWRTWWPSWGWPRLCSGPCSCPSRSEGSVWKTKMIKEWECGRHYISFINLTKWFRRNSNTGNIYCIIWLKCLY